MIFGEIGNFSAYGFAPASLVAPLGTTTVIGMYSFKIKLCADSTDSLKRSEVPPPVESAH